MESTGNTMKESKLQHEENFFPNLKQCPLRVDFLAESFHYSMNKNMWILSMTKNSFDMLCTPIVKVIKIGGSSLCNKDTLSLRIHNAIKRTKHMYAAYWTMNLPAATDKSTKMIDGMIDILFNAYN